MKSYHVLKTHRYEIKYSPKHYDDQYCLQHCLVQYDSTEWEGQMSSVISKNDTSIPQVHTEHEAKMLQILVSQVDAL